MKTNKYLLVGMVAGAIVCSCAKESVEPSLTTKGEVVTMRASLPDDFTKVSLTDESTYMDLKWESEDTIAVVGNTCEYFTIDAYDSKASVFKGVKPEGTAYDVIIPGGKAAYSSVSEVLARSYAGQTQTGDASTAHLEYNVWLTGVDDCENVTFSEAWATEHGGDFHTNGVLKLYCKMPEGAETLTKIVVKAPNAIFYSTNEATSQVDNISLDLKGVEIPSDTRIVTAYIMTSANDVIVPAGTVLTVDMTIDQRVYSKEIVLSATEDKVLKAGRVSVIKLNDQTWDIPMGTLSNPYQLSTIEDLLAMNSHLVKDDTTYFKLMNDIDMSSVSASDWTPVFGLNKFIVFDGQNHTISNFTAKDKAGFFNILAGTVKNVTFDNAVGTNAILAEYIGYTDGTRPGIIDNVTVKATLAPTGTCAGAMAGNISKNSKIVNCKNCELTIASTDQHYVGGLVGRINDASNVLIDNCSVAVNITSTAGEGRVGGIVGANNYRGSSSTAQSDITISNCSVSGKISSAKYYAGGVIGRGTELMTISNCTSSVDVSGANYVGGIVGAVEYDGTASKKTTISSCTSTGTITGTSNYVGGIAGYGKFGSFYSCTSSAAVSSNGNYVGGIVGQLPGSGSRSYISKCAFTGSVTATGTKSSQYAGGIAGGIGYTILEQSYSTATVSNAYRFTGGISGEATSSSIVRDCWSSGEISVGTEGRAAGGIVGFSYSNFTITNCYSTASIKAPYVIGGILGIAGSFSQQTGKNVSVSNCVAWNTTIECSQAEQSYSSGAVTGYMDADLPAKDCYRRSDMSFTDTRTEWTLFDMENTSSTEEYALANPNTANGHYPYHGKAAASDATVSSLAQTLGWDTEIWDFSAALPVLKWTK